MSFFLGVGGGVSVALFVLRLLGLGPGLGLGLGPGLLGLGPGLGVGLSRGLSIWGNFLFFFLDFFRKWFLTGALLVHFWRCYSTKSAPEVHQCWCTFGAVSTKSAPFIHKLHQKCTICSKCTESAPVAVHFGCTFGAVSTKSAPVLFRVSAGLEKTLAGPGQIWTKTLAGPDGRVAVPGWQEKAS